MWDFCIIEQPWIIEYDLSFLMDETDIWFEFIEFKFLQHQFGSIKGYMYEFFYSFFFPLSCSLDIWLKINYTFYSLASLNLSYRFRHMNYEIWESGSPMMEKMVVFTWVGWSWSPSIRKKIQFLWLIFPKIIGSNKCIVKSVYWTKLWFVLFVLCRSAG